MAVVVCDAESDGVPEREELGLCVAVIEADGDIVRVRERDEDAD